MKTANEDFKEEYGRVNEFNRNNAGGLVNNFKKTMKQILLNNREGIYDELINSIKFFGSSGNGNENRRIAHLYLKNPHFFLQNKSRNHKKNCTDCKKCNKSKKDEYETVIIHNEINIDILSKILFLFQKIGLVIPPFEVIEKFLNFSIEKNGIICINKLLFLIAECAFSSEAALCISPYHVLSIDNYIEKFPFFTGFMILTNGGTIEKSQLVCIIDGKISRYSGEPICLNTYKTIMGIQIIDKSFKNYLTSPEEEVGNLINTHQNHIKWFLDTFKIEKLEPFELLCIFGLNEFYEGKTEKIMLKNITISREFKLIEKLISNLNNNSYSTGILIDLETKSWACFLKKQVVNIDEINNKYFGKCCFIELDPVDDKNEKYFESLASIGTNNQKIREILTNLNKTFNIK